ncbi:MAG: maleylpyruvate isomerase family mycothiol-dependent enzyme [Actinomycetota bacterium]
MDQLAALADLQGRFLETTRRADPAVRIPWLGRWTVQSLVVHLSRIHHWAAGQARRRQEEPLGRGPFDLPELYESCARELREALAELDPDARAWTLLDDGVPRGEQTGTVAFWHRRQALETLVHLWDLRTAIGEQLDVDDEAWLDCLDEVVTVMHPRQLRLERVTPPAVRIAFAPTGTDAVLELAGAPADAPEAVVRGPVRSLALLAWGRGVPDEDRLAAHGVTVEGERSLAEATVRAGLTP